MMICPRHDRQSASDYAAKVTFASITQSLTALDAFHSGTFTGGLAGGTVGGVQTVGGIGIDKGVCLCTGRAQDDGTVGFGVEGPNNADPEDGLGINQGEASKDLHGDDDGDSQEDGGDPDLAVATGVDIDNTTDRCVLEFQVTTSEPGYIQVQVVFASDEYPSWLDQSEVEEIFDDAFAVFVHPAAEPLDPANDNIAAFRGQANPQVLMPFSMFEADDKDCTQIFTENQSNPNNPLLEGAAFYNHEYNFFTDKFLFETPDVLGPGQYRIKIVIHDVGAFGPDEVVDSALFIEAGSVRLNTAPLIDGDYSGNGLVEQADLDLVLNNWGAPASPPPSGWVNDLPEGVVDQAELDGVLAGWGDSEFRADFDRDGDVDQTDRAILDNGLGLTACVTHFLGDANDDGAINATDENIWEAEEGGGTAGLFDLVMEAGVLCQYPPAPFPAPDPRFPAPLPPPPPIPQEDVPAAPAPQIAPGTSPTAPSDAAPALAPSTTHSTLTELTGPGAFATQETATQTTAVAETASAQPSPYPSTRAAGHPRYDAIRVILRIAYERWSDGDTLVATEVWKGVGRVYGQYVLDDSTLAYLNQ